ncbi:MAG: hypothetical protein J1F12_06805 [Muribaculaceae bacterium]|nr:hypothetical protein [Muribaculaceae bacterium]
MKNLDNLLKIGHNDDPERVIYLLELALKAVTLPFDNIHSDDNFSSEIAEKLCNVELISKEIQQQKLAEIIEKLQHRFQQNDVKMTEIGQ